MAMDLQVNSFVMTLGKSVYFCFFFNRKMKAIDHIISVLGFYDVKLFIGTVGTIF